MVLANTELGIRCNKGKVTNREIDRVGEFICAREVKERGREKEKKRERGKLHFVENVPFLSIFTCVTNLNMFDIGYITGGLLGLKIIIIIGSHYFCFFSSSLTFNSG